MQTMLKRHHRRGTCHWRDLIRALEAADFVFARMCGSHAIYLHRPTGHTVPVPLSKQDVSNGTLAKLLREVREITGCGLCL